MLRWYNRLPVEVVEEVLELVVFVEVIGQVHVHCRRMVDWSRWRWRPVRWRWGLVFWLWLGLWFGL